MILRTFHDFMPSFNLRPKAPTNEGAEDKQNREFYAVLAGSTYNPDKSKRDELIDKFYPDRKVDVIPEFSNDRLTTFQDANGKVFVSVAGTDFQNKRNRRDDDIQTNVFLSAGLLVGTNRYKQDSNDLRQVIDKYGKENVSITGHSLGGSLAIELGEAYDIPAYAYNPGGTPKTFNIFGSPRKETNIYYSKPGKKGLDFLSLTTLFSKKRGNVHFVEQKDDLSDEQAGGLYPHSIFHFTPN